jgi:hypothetical protein
MGQIHLHEMQTAVHVSDACTHIRDNKRGGWKGLGYQCNFGESSCEITLWVQGTQASLLSEVVHVEHSAAPRVEDVDDLSHFRSESLLFALGLMRQPGGVRCP